MHWWGLLRATEIRRFQRTGDDLELHAVRISNVSTTKVKHNWTSRTKFKERSRAQQSLEARLGLFPQHKLIQVSKAAKEEQTLRPDSAQLQKHIYI